MLILVSPTAIYETSGVRRFEIIAGQLKVTYTDGTTLTVVNVDDVARIWAALNAATFVKGN